MAFGFKIGRVAAGVGRRLTPAAAPEPVPIALEPSRAQRLAFDLQRDPAYAEARAPASDAAGAATTSAGRRAVEVKPTPRLGDDYRRPDVAMRRLKVR